MPRAENGASVPAEVWRGFKNDRGTDSGGTKRKRRDRLFENISAIFFRTNKRTYVRSPCWRENAGINRLGGRKQRTLSVFQCEIRERSRVHLRDERPQSAHEEVSWTMDGINSRVRATCSTHRHCNEFCQFTEQTRLTVSSRPGRKKGSRCSRSDAKYSTVTQLFRNVFTTPTRFVAAIPSRRQKQRNKSD